MSGLRASDQALVPPLAPVPPSPPLHQPPGQRPAAIAWPGQPERSQRPFPRIATGVVSTQLLAASRSALAHWGPCRPREGGAGSPGSGWACESPASPEARITLRSTDRQADRQTLHMPSVARSPPCHKYTRRRPLRGRESPETPLLPFSHLCFVFPFFFPLFRLALSRCAVLCCAVSGPWPACCLPACLPAA